MGVAAAAPASELATLINDDLTTPGGKNIARYDTVVMGTCLWRANSRRCRARGNADDRSSGPGVHRVRLSIVETRRITERPLEQNFLSVSSPSDVEPWRSLLARNTPATLPPGVPVFFAQGTTDAITPPSDEKDYMQRLCKAGSRVRLLMTPGVGHGLVAERSARTAVAWMADRFTETPRPAIAGRKQTGHCRIAHHH